MRSSSIKSTAAVITVTLALIVVAPTVTARPNRLPAGTPSVVKQFEQAADRAATTVRRLLSRFFAPAANGWAQPPLPSDTSLTSPEESTEETTTITTPTSKKP